MFNIDSDMILSLDYKGLYGLAEFLERQAEICRGRAHKLEQRTVNDRHFERQLDFYKRLPRIVCKYLRHGQSLPDAKGLAARDADVPFGTVEKYWDDFIATKDKKSMSQRNQLLIDLAAIGFTNAQMAERVGLHANSVSRIISQERKRRLWMQNRKDHPLLLEEIQKQKSAPQKERAQLRLVKN